VDARTIDTLADRLIAAETSRTPIELPSVEYPTMTLDDGYRVQRAIVAKKVARGARVVGKKIAFTSRPNQALFGIHEPAYGFLLDSGVHASDTTIESDAFIQPIIECELVFVMRRRLGGPGITGADVLRATEGAMPALEIADSRLRNWIGRAKASDIVADSCGNAGLVVGGTLHAPQHVDLRDTTVVAEKNGEIIATAATGAVMGNPAEAVAWLVNKLAESELALEEGELVLSGAVIGALPVVPGDVLRAVFGGGLGPIGVTLTERATAGARAPRLPTAVRAPSGRRSGSRTE
jgi:2-keto-4-pentenoate hydratase